MFRLKIARPLEAAQVLVRQVLCTVGYVTGLLPELNGLIASYSGALQTECSALATLPPTLSHNRCNSILRLDAACNRLLLSLETGFATIDVRTGEFARVEWSLPISYWSGWIWGDPLSFLHFFTRTDDQMYRVDVEKGTHELVHLDFQRCMSYACSKFGVAVGRDHFYWCDDRGISAQQRTTGVLTTFTMNGNIGKCICIAESINALFVVDQLNQVFVFDGKDNRTFCQENRHLEFVTWWTETQELLTVSRSNDKIAIDAYRWPTCHRRTITSRYEFEYGMHFGDLIIDTNRDALYTNNWCTGHAAVIVSGLLPQ